MSQVPSLEISAATPAASVAASASSSEKNATSSKNILARTTGLRSCVVCRTRKVRCDKFSPCSNCRRANIACVFPSKDRPPRWARRLERVATDAASDTQVLLDSKSAAAQVMERVQNLESLVKDLRSQLEHANAAASSVTVGSSEANSPGSSSHDRDIEHQRDAWHDTGANINVQKQFGRLVVQDADRSRYVSSGFWSRISDELDGLRLDSRGLGTGDSGTSEDEDSSGQFPSTQEIKRPPSERHAFLFRHNINSSGPDIREFQPLPSQIPFLLDVFSENVNSIARMIHIPTVAKMVRDLRGNSVANLTPANEALMFSIYYAAVTSMEEDDIITNFGFTKTDLSLRYRMGLEYALAKADFLNVPDLVLVQALAIFLCLVRCHDSPRFVWMMTGLLVRMGQALGLHRDGAHFGNLTPYEVEMRRRIWWTICVLDVRAAEDQGMDYTIAYGSFDTKLPLNINDEDIGPGRVEIPTVREGICDMSFPLVVFKTCEVTKQMMTQNVKEGPPDMEEKNRHLSEIYQDLDRGYLQHSESSNIAYWVAVVIARLIMAKMTLLIYLPLLFSSVSEQISGEIKTKLLIAAIEIAEYNHALNTEPACRHWRWVYQTYTHWYAVVYLLIEISRRPWSAIVERAWVALHSQWLIPSQSHMDKNLQFWIPLKKLTAKARKHRDAELEWLRRHPRAAEELEMEDQRNPDPASPGLFTAGSNAVESFRERWRQLLAIPEQLRPDTRMPGRAAASESAHYSHTMQPSTSSTPGYDAGNSAFGARKFETGRTLSSIASQGLQPATTTNGCGVSTTEQTTEPSFNAFNMDLKTWSASSYFDSWLLADADPSVDLFANIDVDALDINMDLDGKVDWYDWVDSAKNMETGLQS